MNKYEGYLTGVNPNRLRKLVGEEKFYAYESATGTFVNGQGGEVKTMAEAIKKNDETEKELKEAWPPQKAIGAKNVSLAGIEKKIATMGDPKSDGAWKAFVERNKREEIEEKKRQLRIKNHTKQQWGIQDKKLADLPIIKNNINYQKIPNQDLKSNMRKWIREADNEKKQNLIESDASVRRRVWEKVEKNRAKGKKDYEDFASHDIRIADEVAETKKLQKEISDNLNAYLTDAVKDKRFVNYTPISTPDFIRNPKPKSMGIAHPDLAAERKIISEVFDEKN